MSKKSVCPLLLLLYVTCKQILVLLEILLNESLFIEICKNKCLDASLNFFYNKLSWFQKWVYSNHSKFHINVRETYKCHLLPYIFARIHMRKSLMQLFSWCHAHMMHILKYICVKSIITDSHRKGCHSLLPWGFLSFIFLLFFHLVRSDLVPESPSGGHSAQMK